MAEIVEQGEGMARDEVWDGDKDVFHPERDEVAHYYRFMELQAGRRYQRGDTPSRARRATPSRVDPEGVHPITGTASSDEFNRTCRELLRSLEGRSTATRGLLGQAVGTMFAGEVPAPGLDRGRAPSPTFEYVDEVGP